MKQDLARVVTAALQGMDAAAFLQAVRSVVYGSQGYSSVYRIDDCELTSARLCVRVSDRSTGKVVYAYSQRRPALRRVA